MHQQFHGTLTERDHKRHLAHHVTVPDGTTRLAVRLTFAPHMVGDLANMLCLSLFDSHGCRGAGHRHGSQHDLLLTADAATPGFVPGPLEAGRWSVVIDTHMVLPDAPCTYTLDIWSTDEPLAAPVVDAPPRTPPAPRGPGWYRGDLHAHTIHSDAHWDIPDLLAAASARHLDFVTLTDHNTVSGLADFDRLATDDLLTLGGMELTTFWGHALALGTRHWVDWRSQPGQRSMVDIAHSVMADGALFVIAHPCSPGDPLCTGCDWRYVEMMPGTAPAVEVWNGLWDGDSNNERALALWYGWLNAGHRLVATAGTDAHGPAFDSGRLGWNVVYADSRTESDILGAVRRGRLYLSTGPQLAFGGRGADGRTAMIGETLAAGAAALHARWADGPDRGQLRLIADGAVRASAAAEALGERHWNLPAGTARWCVVELRDGDDILLAVTNPIFIGS
jgi:hypothetical protein